MSTILKENSLILSVVLISIIIMAFTLFSCVGDGDDSGRSGTSPTDDDNDVDDDSDDDVDDDDTEDLTRKFVHIEAGTFQMGSPETELGRDEECEKLHTVTLTNDFSIMATEVTQGFYEEIMGYSHDTCCRESGDDYALATPYWYEAIAFCIKLSEQEGLNPCYLMSDIECHDETQGDSVDYCKDHNGVRTAQVELNGVVSPYECEGYRLPTEAEWEYSIRAGTTTAFYSGDITYNDCDNLDPNLDLIGWYCVNSATPGDPYIPHKVARKLENNWGLYDMSGNVAEWVWDSYMPDYENDTTTDPFGSVNYSLKVFRGGIMNYWSGGCRSASRYYLGGYSCGIGFRVAKTY